VAFCTGQGGFLVDINMNETNEGLVNMNAESTKARFTKTSGFQRLLVAMASESWWLNGFSNFLDFVLLKF